MPYAPEGVLAFLDPAPEAIARGEGDMGMARFADGLIR